MSNNTLYTNVGEYGNYRTGQVGPIVQGQSGVVMLFTIYDLAGQAVDLTGYTITGKLRQKETQVVAELVGATAVTANADDGELSWTTDADDIGESGEYAIWFRATRAGYPTYITFPTPLVIVEDDDVSGTFTANLVGVTVAQANWLAAAVTAMQAGTEDHIVTIDGDGNLQDGGAAIADLVAVAGDTMTGALQFSGTSHVGLVVISLTTAQRDAIGSPATGALIWNSTAGEIQTYNGSAWVSVAGGHSHDSDYLQVTNNLSDLDDAAAARTNLDVDQAGTDNSTNVTLAGTPDYITISGQVITRNQIDLTADVTGDLPVTEGGTGASDAATARSNLGVGAGDSPQFAGVNVGHASDTTITRTGAGDIAVEGNALYRAGGTDVPVTDGGTGASSAADARTNLGLVAGGAGDIWVEKAGDTMSGELNMADQLLTRPKLKDYGEAVNAIGSVGGGTQDINLELGNAVSATIDTSTTTFTYSNPPASGTEGSFTLYLTNGGSQTVNWPSSVKWAGGTPPALTASGVDILVFTTVDGGTNWYGFAAGLNMS